MLLENKVILVAGAGGLLGREIVRSVVQEGGRVIAADMNAALVNLLVDQLGQDRVLACHMDITDKTSIENVFSSADEFWQHVTGAVNTAYPRSRNYGRQPPLEVTYDDFCENVGLHLGGYFLFMQQCAVYSKTRNVEFSLVNLSSIYGSIAPKFDIYENVNMTMPVEYAAIKSAVLHITGYFNAYMKGSGFRANCVSPGGIAAGQSSEFMANYRNKCSRKGMLDCPDVTGAISYLLSDISKYVVSQNIVVDDGFSL